jgi:hypothetical protein
LRVTLVQAPRWTVFTPPYSLAVLAGVLRRQGFPVAVRDYDVALYNAVTAEERALWDDRQAAFWDDDGAVTALVARHEALIDGFIDDILATEPDVVGFSVKVRSRLFSVIMADRLKLKRARVQVIFGGPDISDGVERFLRRFVFVDATCAQEAELSLPSYLRKFAAAGLVGQPEPGFCYRDAERVPHDAGPIRQPPAIEDLGMADYADFDFSIYQNPHALTMQLSRGCINRCSFCAESPSFLTFRARPAEQVHAEILHHAARTSVRPPLRIYFNDSLLNGDLDQLERLCDLLIEQPVPGGLSFSGMMLVREGMDERLVAKLARAGMVEVFFGLETGSEKMIRLMRKGFRLSEAARLLRLFHQAGIAVFVSIIFGHPGESESDFHDTLDFLQRIEPDVDGFLFNLLSLQGSSSLTRHPERYGITEATKAAHWVGDGGANTLAVRRARRRVACTLFRDKTVDIGAFGADPVSFDPAGEIRRRLEGRERLVADALAFQARRGCPGDEPAAVPAGYIDEIRALGPGWVRVSGWAVDPVSGVASGHVVLLDGAGRLLGYTTADLPRLDVMAGRGLGARHAGWAVEIACDDPRGLARELRAGIYRPERHVCCWLRNDGLRVVV